MEQINRKYPVGISFSKDERTMTEWTVKVK